MIISQVNNLCNCCNQAHKKQDETLYPPKNQTLFYTPGQLILSLKSSTLIDIFKKLCGCRDSLSHECLRLLCDISFQTSSEKPYKRVLNCSRIKTSLGPWNVLLCLIKFIFFLCEWKWECSKNYTKLKKFFTCRKGVKFVAVQYTISYLK